MNKFRVKELAKAQGFTQEALAQRSGVTISTVRRLWQNSNAEEPRASTMLALATALNVTISDLYGSDDQSSPTGVILPSNQISLVGALS